MDFKVEINAILNGDLNTFEVLVQRFQKPIFKFLIGMGIPKDHVEIRLKKVKSFFGFQNESLESEKSESDLDRRLQNQDQQKLIRRALENLPAAQKSAFVLFYYSDLSLEEISVIENCSIGTVKSRLGRFRKRIPFSKQSIFCAKSDRGHQKTTQLGGVGSFTSSK